MKAVTVRFFAIADGFSRFPFDVYVGSAVPHQSGAPVMTAANF